MVRNYKNPSKNRDAAAPAPRRAREFRKIQNSNFEKQKFQNQKGFFIDFYVFAFYRPSTVFFRKKYIFCII